MYLKHVPTADLIEVINLQDVINPFSGAILARGYMGDRPHMAEYYPKDELVFPSGEPLPKCWTEKQFHERIVV